MKTLKIPSGSSYSDIKTVEKTISNLNADYPVWKEGKYIIIGVREEDFDNVKEVLRTRHCLSVY